jgi:hypothetical protein
MNFELYIPTVPRKKKPGKINWTPEMIQAVKEKFPYNYNRKLAEDIGVSVRSLIRKARELGVEKEQGFLDKRRDEISAMATEAKPPHPFKGVKGWCVPNGEATRFKPGQISIMSVDRDLVEKVRSKRNKTIARDRARIRMGLPQLTHLKLNT